MAVQWLSQPMDYDDQLWISQGRGTREFVLCVRVSLAGFSSSTQMSSLHLTHQG